MRIHQWRLGPMANFVYLVAEGDAGFVIDPAFELPKLLENVQRAGARVTHILATHGHPDHIQGIAPLKAATGARVLAHESADHPVDQTLRDAETLEIGGIRVRVVHTPGHRFDSVCYVVNDAHVFTGDTLFVGDCGRVDLPGSDVRAMHRSLLEVVAKLPRELAVYPGHDYGPKPTSTIDEELRTNGTLKPRTLDEFVRFMAEP